MDKTYTAEATVKHVDCRADIVILHTSHDHFKNRKCSFRSTPPIIGGVGNILLKKLIDYYSTQNEVFVPKCLPRVACIPNTAQNRNKLSLTPEIELRLSGLGTGYIVTAVDDDISKYNDDITLEYLDCILSVEGKAVGPNETNKSVGELTWMEPPGTQICMEIFKTNKGFKRNGTHTITQLPKELDFTT